MPDAASEISRDALIAYVEENGLTVTADQLVRWHKKGLLPRPRRRHLGRGKGTESVYPTIAAAQACVIVMLLDLFPRNLDSVGWCLWCFGFAVTPFARQSLIDFLKEEQQKASERYQAMVDGTEDDYLSALSEGRAPSGWGRVRRRLGKRRTGEVAAVLQRLLLGDSWTAFSDTLDENREYEAVLEAIWSQLRITEGSPEAQQQSVRDLPEALNFLSDEFNLDALLAALERVSDGNLIYLRDAIQTILHRSGLFPGAEQAIVPKELFLVWFALRYASPTIRDSYKDAPDKLKKRLVAEPSVVARALFRQRRTAMSTDKKPTALDESTERKES